MKNARKHTSTTLVVVEGVLTAIPFLLSWWVCSMYRSVVAGWAVSGMKAHEKRAALRELMGDHANAG